MEKRRIISSALTVMLTAGLLTGCGKSDTNANTTDGPSESVLAYNQVQDAGVELKIDEYGRQAAPQVYQEYEHLFMTRYNYDDALSSGSLEHISGASVPVPEGYEVVDIENFNGMGGKIGTTETYGVDIWYTNIVPVEVYPVYNEAFQAYDYSHPGKVLPKENVVDTDKTLNKK